MEEEILTYEDIRKVFRKEKEENSLVKVEEDFLKKVSIYLSEKRRLLEEARKEEGKLSREMAEKLELEIKHALSALEKWYNLRERKILDLALVGVKTRNVDLSKLLADERELFEKLVEILREYRERFKNLFQTQPKPKKPHSDKQLVRVIEKIDKFLWTDGNTYGPYEEGEVANLPKEIAQHLIELGKVEEVKVEDEES
ncbi:MAG: hypothetical protein QW507_00540 [Candidatus Nanoarchaeia archaeon]|nr:hypothetical protein [Candidatus Haiyanarchaeum thermophilum]MCW1302932.1 hypothetical protein [Candidatus Haiyanarchaeum thermophilum]MCW1303609.1 hypothetical protein [Candidatus Haiyanarchaeum thermophilum]MCW1306291.1 hypothetical protein [Candidatus Haiyanarchaeum thermophilum]MCW1307199.1 hypothetical protein [Candidatus Haiyanarchaeum thermophilum]